MKLVNRFDYQKLEQITRNDGVRHYRCPVTDKLVPSSTTILSQTADKTALKEWESFVGAEKAERTRKEATALGSLMHAHLEAYVLGEPRPRGNNLIRLLSERMANRVIENGLCHVDEVWGAEVSMFMPGLYAGTTDLVGVYKGRTAIMDFKTAKKMRSQDMIKDYVGQIGSYCLCHDEVYGTKIEMGVVFMVSRDLEFKAFEYEGDELEEGKVDFLMRLDRFLDETN